MSNKRPRDIWNEIAKEDAQVNKVKAESFVNSSDDHREGMSARREKFIKDLNTGSPKVLPANKRDRF